MRPIAERGVADGLAERRVEVVGRGDLDDLLVPPLDRAVALVEVDQMAVRVAQQLHLDVLGAADELLEEDVGAAEGGLGLAAGLVERRVELLGRLDDPHAAAAAPHRRLDDHRIAQGLGRLLGLRARLDGSRLPERTGTPASVARARAATLSPSRSRSSGRGPTKTIPASGAGPGELGVLGQEAVAGVDRVDLLLLRQLDDRLDVQVAADRLAGLAHLVGLVGLEPVQGEPVLVGIDGHGADAQLVGRAEDPDGDLAPIGDHQLAKLGHRNIPTGWVWWVRKGVSPDNSGRAQHSDGGPA